MGQNRVEMQQSYQQRTNNQLQTINEILMKSKSALNNMQKNQEQMKVFPDDPPPPPKPAPSNSSDKKSLKIQLSRLNPHQIEQMGKSVTDFVKNSPDSAKKLGVIKDDLDIFSLMKADERNLKRKPVENDVCPCKCLFLVFCCLQKKNVMRAQHFIYKNHFVYSLTAKT